MRANLAIIAIRTAQKMIENPLQNLIHKLKSLKFACPETSAGFPLCSNFSLEILSIIPLLTAVSAFPNATIEINRRWWEGIRNILSLFSLHTGLYKEFTKYSFILTLFLMSCLFAQSGNLLKIEGHITYITMDQVYCDIGSAKDAEVGDTLTVLRRNDEIGLLVITNIARKSSVTLPLVPVDQFQLGDRIVLEKFIPDKLALTQSENDQLSERIPEKTTAKIHTLFSQNATISLRYSYNKFSENISDSRGIGTVQYRAGLTSFLHTKILVYGRSNLMDRDFTLYQARAEIQSASKKHQLQVGRVFPSDMPGVGATDGFLYSSKLKQNISTGLLAGFQPDYKTLTWNPDVKKIGVFTKGQYQFKKMKFRSVVSLVGQYAGKDIDREFSYIKFTADIRRKLNISVYQTWDFYRKQSIYQRSKLEPTSNQISLRFRPFRPITITSRYTTRKQVLYTASGSLLPDSLFIDELRTGWYNSLRFSHDKIGSIITGVNRRGQSGSKDASTYIFLNYFSRKIKKHFSFHSSSSYIHNLIITGLRNRLGMNVSTDKFGTFYAEYELYTYGYGNFYNDYYQNSLKVNHTWSLWDNLRGTMTIDYLKDNDYDVLVFYLGLTYRL